MANTFTLAGTFKDAKNNPIYVGEYVIFRITSVGTDTEDAVAYPRDPVSMLIDENGDFGDDLWVNGDSGTQCFYEVRDPSGQRLDLIFPSETEATTVRYEFALENYLAAASPQQGSPALEAHIADQGNPHVVTAAQVGAYTEAEANAEFVNKTGEQSVTGSKHFSYIDLVTSLGITSGGTGASTAADARINLGIGGTTTSVTTELHSASTLDKYILASRALGVTVFLLSAAVAGDGFEVTVKNVGATGTVTVVGAFPSTIDGSTTAALTTQYESITVVSDGTTWNII